MKINKTFFAVALCFSSVAALGQNAQTGDDTLSTEEVIIIKEFEPSIAAARKLNTGPQSVALKTEPLSFKYTRQEVSYTSDFAPDSIKAARLKGEPLSRLYRAYVKAGMGNFLTTYGDVYVNSLRSRNTRWGVEMHHRASNNGIADLPENTFSTNSASVYGTKFLKAHKLHGNVGYTRQRVHYYGLADTYADSIDGTEIDASQIEQTYNIVTGQALLESYFSDSSSINYTADVSYNFLSTPEYTSPVGTTESVQENHLLAKTRFERYFGNELALLNLDFDYNNQNVNLNGADTAVNNANFFVRINPQIEFKGVKWRLSMGLSAFIENEDATDFRFYPNAYFKYNVYNDYIIPYLGINGGLTRVNYNSLRQANPFLASDLTLENQNTRYNIYGGIRGAFSSQISFNIQASLRQEANVALFQKADTTVGAIVPANFYARSQGAFTTVYDTLNITHLKGELTFFAENKFNLLVSGEYFSFDPVRQAKAWHIPELVATVTGRYDLRDKIVAMLDVMYVGERFARTYNASEGEQVASELINGAPSPIYAVKLDGYLDANIGLEYRYNKKLSGFVQVNNILNTGYQRWHDYQVQGINVMFGVTYGFWSRN